MAVHRRPGEVTAVICAAFDPDLDAAVLRQVAVLRACGPAVGAPRHPPHLTLGAASVPKGELDAVRGIVAGLATRVRPFAVRLDHLGAFPGGVVWLGPRPTAALAALQAELDAELRAAGHPRAFGDRSAPEHWVAHCTVARRLPASELGCAIGRLADGFRPLIGQVDRLLTIRLGDPGDAEQTPLPGAGTR